MAQGDPAEVAVIRRIFHEAVDLKHSEHRVAEGLNDDGIPPPSGRRWTTGAVLKTW